MAEYICDIRGHYWLPSKADIRICRICGVGGKVVLGSEDDIRRDKRRKPTERDET